MNFLRNYKIRTKLLLYSSLLISMLLIIAIIYHLTLSGIESSFVRVLDEEHHVVDKAAFIKSLMLECNVNEKNFLLHSKIIYADLVQQGIQQIKDETDLIKDFVNQGEAKEVIQLVGEISRSIDGYGRTFAMIVAGKEKMGLTHELGLQGKFRKTAHRLFNEHVIEHAVGDLLVAYTRMEKNLYNNSDSVETFVNDLKGFGESVRSHSMRPIYAEKIENNLMRCQNLAEDYAHAVSTAEKEYFKNEIRKLALEMEQILTTMYIPNVRELVLQIRRHEKDYLLRGELLYIQKNHQAIATLTDQIVNSKLDTDDTRETLQFLQEYQKDFDLLVDEDRKISLMKTRLRDRAMEVNLAVEKIGQITRTKAEDNMSSRQAQTRTALTFAVSFCLMTIALALLVSLLVTNSITKPLQRIMNGVKKMTDGDYSTRLETIHNSLSETGILAALFNKMADTIENDSWHTEGGALLAEELRGDKDERQLCRDILVFLANYVDAQLGAIYVQQDDNTYRLVESYSCSLNEGYPSVINAGEGIIGETARSGKMLRLSELKEDCFRIHSSFGEAIPKEIIVLPLQVHGVVLGVIELGFVTPFTEVKVGFLERIAESIAIAIYTSKQRDKTIALLLETQQQSEELQTQQEELKTSNEELEEQTQNLRQNEEELKSQQEELQVSNEELEEKTEALEIRNIKILEKNTALKNARADIERKSKEVEAASHYKSEFLANMSHELRTPLNSLLLLARNLVKNKDGNLNDGQVQSANIIYNSGEELLKLINDILDLSKIESGHMEAAHEQIGIRGFADWINANFIHMAAEKGLDLAVTIESGLPKVIVTDRQKLEQIVRNLVANAIKFTGQGGVTIGFDRPGQAVVFSNSDLDVDFVIAISVTDTGIGIAEDKQSIIFDAFKQAEGGTSRKYGGTGLGLSISRKLAHLLGGEIQLNSAEGRGATFTLYLPFMTDENIPLKMEEPPQKSGDDTNYQTPVVNSEKRADVPVKIVDVPDDRQNLNKEDRIILIIEDDPVFAKIILDLGHTKGFKCLVAVSGFDGLDLAERYKPGAIILDIRLPDIDGWQVLDSLKNNSSLRHIPVHMMSGEEKHIEAFKKGAIGFLTKPISEEAINDAFDRLEDASSTRVRELLIVEDDDVMVQEIIELIGQNDITVIIAKNGKEAISILTTRKIDCMILDIGLPDMTGFTLLERLGAIDSLEVPPVIIYTGRELTKAEGDSLMHYTDTVIIKGVKSEERLLDETSLFLHRIVSEMPIEKRKMIASLYDQDAMFNDKKIMVVDDDMRNAFALSRILEERGMKITIAHDGQHALSLLEEDDDISLILMDIMMPVMDGFETMTKIRAQEKFWDVPIIALTANAMPEDKVKCMESGASDYLAKPVEEGRLLSMMRVWLYR